MKLNQIVLILLFACVPFAFGQADQGTITGVLQDPTGAVISNAAVTLHNVDTGQILKSSSDSSGVFVFSPVKIGNYSITASLTGFDTTTQIGLHLSLQQRLNVPITMRIGATSETITVDSAAPIMQTQDSSVGQVLDTKAIDSVPLNGRNWVYIAQLTAGAVPPQGTRGAGTGDFNANGQRAEQNNFILDGIDNNNNLVDIATGASYVSQPPPDALAEFKVQTGNYSAEFGHSAGAVVNASLKSGTNSVHGSVWEYFRNTVFDAKDWNAKSVPPYHENQFGATLGLPILRNKLFFFADIQANRVSYTGTITTSVPTVLERTGDFSELLNTGLTGKSAPIQLYYQNPVTGPQPFPNNNLKGISNVAPNANNLAILNLYPLPNANNGRTFNNYLFSPGIRDNTVQWDTRLDWNISSKDSAYSRLSYFNEPFFQQPTLGVLDGLSSGGSRHTNLGQTFMLSESHIFTNTLTNEFRTGYSHIHAQKLPSEASDPNYATKIGFGGIPGGYLNGGLPFVVMSGAIANFGSSLYTPTDEYLNSAQLLDNITKVLGNHTIKIGGNAQSIRFSTLQPVSAKGNYVYTGINTSNLGAANTGSPIADFVFDLQNNANVSSESKTGDSRWYDALYAQDDWRITKTLTLNLGLRWEYYQPYKDVGGYQASYNLTGTPTLNTTTGVGSVSALYRIPQQTRAYAQSVFAATNNLFPNLLTKDNIALQYGASPQIITGQTTNFAPRFGIAYSPDLNTVVRAGYGIFYGGLESSGYYANLGQNYPYQFSPSYLAASCTNTYCPTDGITVASGFGAVLANGFASSVSNLALRGIDPHPVTPYTQSYNFTVERALPLNLFATAGYVGNNSHHLQATGVDPNNSLALENPRNSVQSTRPLPDFGSTSYIAYIGNSNYNSLQTKLEKRLSHGNSLLATYTWSHSLDDAPPQLTTTSLDAQYRQSNLIPIHYDYSNSSFDTRHRFTINAFVEVPVGAGRKYLSKPGVLNLLLGGWSTNTTFVAQTGNPFSVSTTGISTAAGGKALAVSTRNQYTAGGTFVSPNPNIVVQCATRTRTRANWYNPCSFQNPWNPNDFTNEPQHYIPTSPADPHYTAAMQPIYVTSLASSLGFLGGRRNSTYGPGYERINMSLFKNFALYHEHTLQFRTDMFNVFNTPSLGQPSDTSIDSTGGQITGPRVFQNETPDARFFQFSLKYAF
jgi:hypothetical protein